MRLALLLSALLSFQISYADDLLEIIGDKNTTSVEANIVQAPLVKEVRQSIGSVNAEQNIFLNFLAAQDYEKALFQWASAFEKSSFKVTDEGKALYEYIKFKNALRLSAVESLLQTVNAKNTGKAVRDAWAIALKEDKEIWSLVEVNWNSSWTSVFGDEAAALVISRRQAQSKNDKQIVELLKKVPEQSYAREKLVWNLIITYSLNHEAGKAAKLIKYLLKEKNTYVSQSLLNITIARLLYENGYLDAAIEHYKKVTKDSEYWFVAQEELAWSFIRKGEPQNTLAVTKALVPSSFSRYVGPETLFLRALASLKICDYNEVKNMLNEYKARFRPRAVEMMKLSDTQDTSEVNNLIQKLMSDRVQLKDLGVDANKLPFAVSRDERLYHFAQVFKEMDSEAALVEKLYLRSMNEGTAKVGFMASIERLKKESLSKKQRARSVLMGRVGELAKLEVASIKAILQKMHIVEAELLQQISKGSQLAKAKTESKAKMGSTGSQSKYSVSFPYDGELWFDELDNYKVDVVQSCVSDTSKKVK